MSNTPFISLIGCYNYQPDLFAGLSMPEGVDKQKAVNYLLFKYGECPVLYTDTRFLRNMVTVWSDAKGDSLSRIYRAMSTDYDPLHNFDRHEDYTDHTVTEQSEDWDDNRTTDGTLTHGSTSTTENTVSAFNSDGYQPADKSVNTTGGSDTTNETSGGNGSRAGSATGETVHHGHLYGNIGVTKSQEMLQDEIDIRQQSFFDIFADMFRRDFLLYLY